MHKKIFYENNVFFLGRGGEGDFGIESLVFVEEDGKGYKDNQ